MQKWYNGRIPWSPCGWTPRISRKAIEGLLRSPFWIYFFKRLFRKVFVNFLWRARNLSCSDPLLGILLSGCISLCYSELGIVSNAGSGF